MTRASPPFVLVLVLVLGASASAQDFVSPEGRFSVAFPATPTAGRQVAPRPDGVEIAVHMFGLDAGDRAYSLSWFDRPGEDEPAEKVLDDAERAHLGADKTLVSRRRMDLAGRHPGREVVVRAGEFELSGRLFLAGRRISSILFVCESGRAGELAPEAARFLGSFRVIDPAAPAPVPAPGAPPGAAEWVSDEGGFAAAFAAAPEIATRTATAADGRALEARSHFSDAGGFAQSVTFAVFAPDDPAAADVDRLLDGARDGILQASRILRERKIELSGFPGREVHAESIHGKYALRMRFYFARSRLYTITALLSKAGAEALEPDAARFLDSFRLFEPGSDGWNEIASDVGGFRVRLPGSPVTRAQGGDFSMNATAGDLSLFIALFPFPAGPQGPGAALDALAAKTVRGAAEAIVERAELAGRGGPHPGREISRSGDRPDRIAFERMFLVGERLYVIHVDGPKAREAHVRAAAARLFESFKLLE